MRPARIAPRPDRPSPPHPLAAPIPAASRSPAANPLFRLFCWMCGWFRTALRGAPGLFPLRPRLIRCGRGVRAVDGRPLLVGAGLSGHRYPPGSAGQTPPTPIGPGGEGRPRVRDAGGSGHAATGPGVRPRSVWVEGFLPVRGGFSSPTALKPSTHQDTDPTDQVMDDCVSPGRPADRGHVPVEEPAVPRPHPPAVPRPHPPAAPPPHISPKSRSFPQITPHIDRQNPISGDNPQLVGCPLGI